MWAAGYSKEVSVSKETSHLTMRSAMEISIERGKGLRGDRGHGSHGRPGELAEPSEGRSEARRCAGNVFGLGEAGTKVVRRDCACWVSQAGQRGQQELQGVPGA